MGHREPPYDPTISRSQPIPQTPHHLLPLFGPDLIDTRTSATPLAVAAAPYSTTCSKLSPRQMPVGQQPLLQARSLSPIRFLSRSPLRGSLSSHSPRRDSSL